jgi:hypothetical protein
MHDNSDLIEIERRCFAETGNPLHAWAAYSFARVVNAAVPDWVLGYLDSAARNLFDLTAEHQSQQKGREKEIAPKIAAAFGIRGTVLSGYRDNWVVHGANVRHLMREGHQETYAIDYVAEAAGVSTSTVRRALKRYDRLYPDQGIETTFTGS